MNSDKQLWILAGGNGAGKTTWYEQFLKPRGMPFINADILAATLDAEHPENASYMAATLAEQLRLSLIRSSASFCFETVFSHPSKIDFMAEAKSLGYELILVYIHLETDELNQARVAQRVDAGGHSVPTEKIISRIPRTVSNISRALPLADYAVLYDNSSHSRPYRSVAEIKRGALSIKAEPLPAWARAVLADYL